MKNILQINNLSKSYVNKEGIILALKDINLSIIETTFPVLIAIILIRKSLFQSVSESDTGKMLIFQ